VTHPPDYQALQGSERAQPDENKLAEPAGASELVDVTLIVRRSPHAPPRPGIEDLFAAGISRRPKLSREEFAAAYGALQEELDRVAAFARSHGLEVTETNKARRSVEVRGPVGQINKAFALQLRYCDSSRGRYRSYEGPVHLPSVLAGIVEAVIGLDNRPVPARHLAAGDPQNTNTLNPLQVATLYNFPDGTGAGQTIGIYERVTVDFFSGSVTNPGFTPGDLALTLSGFGLGTTPVVKQVPIDGQMNSGISDHETLGDIAISSAIAPGATIAVYFTGTSTQNLIHALQSMIHPNPGDPVPTVLSISYSLSADEDISNFSNNDYTQMDQLFQDAATLGITVFVSSGDHGAASEFSLPGFPARTAYPATDPWVTACGGTTIGNIIPPNVTQNAGGCEIQGSFDEFVWNDSWIDSGTTYTGATGGGISARFPVPLYQNGFPIPLRNGTLTAGRGIPDVAGNASPNSGYPITVQGVSQVFAMTSAVAPLYAGLIARINANVGFSVGFLNPVLYQLFKAVCRNVPKPSGQGPTNNTFGGIAGYPAGGIWNACTGLGTIDGKALMALYLADNPFNFANLGYYNAEGADDVTDDLEYGNWNHGDPSDLPCATVIENSAPTNAALIGRNVSTGDGTVGVFGSSSGGTRSIGVAGQSGTGCGMYGIGMSGTSIGVAGRSMVGEAVEATPLEQVVGQPVGVLGHSTCGAGVRGHSGPLLPLPEGASPLSSLKSGPGGVFSSGQLQDHLVAEGQISQRVSLSALAQLRLVPSIAPKLPVIGQLGDLYVQVIPAEPGVHLSVKMFICVSPSDQSGHAAFWAPVQLGAMQQGG
jgi:kumamolisin